MAERGAYRILIVEDDPLILLFLESALEADGFIVQTAADGAAALSALADPELRLEALVTDIELGPGPDGWAVAAAARRRSPNLPLVFASGVHIDPAELDAQTCALSKPYSADQILGAVHHLLHQPSCAGAAPLWQTRSAR